MYKYDLSIIIVAHNSSGELKVCLPAIFASQTSKTFEVIVVNNSPEDDLTSLISEYHDRFPVQVLTLPNPGFGKANNQGLAVSQGRDILILNPDTEIAPTTLEIMLNFLHSREDIGIATCKLIRPSGEIDPASRRNLPDPWSSVGKLFGLGKLFPHSQTFNRYNIKFNDDQSAEIEACSGAFMLIRRELLTKLDYLFDPDYFMYGEDLDLCYRTRRAGFKVWYYPGTTTIHLKGQSSGKNYKKSLHAFYEAMWIYYKKNVAHNYPAPLGWLVYCGIWSLYYFKLLKSSLSSQKLVSK